VQLLRQLCTRYLCRWLQWTCRRHLRREAMPVLRSIQLVAIDRLTRRSWGKWLAMPYVRRLQRKEVDRAIHRRSSKVLRTFWGAWRTRYLRRRQRGGLQQIRRKALRLLAKRSFQRWLSMTLQRGIALRLEQQSLLCVARRWIYPWIARGRVLLQLKPLRDIGAKNRARVALRRWHSWLFRILRSYQLEQRHLVCLLQRYFVEWVLHHTARGLDYASVASKRLHRGMH
jgi:hypothetical protein